MAGDAPADALVGFLSRLTDERLTADTPISLRSVQRAALSSWARRENLTIHLKAASTKAAFTVRDLLGDAPASGPPAPAPMATPVGAVGGIGIDIEETSSLPATDDYRTHAFYQDHFTASEIAHCIRQGDVRASLCGLWAAKEAVLKSGLWSAPSGRLADIDIGHDGRGRPMIPGGHLSISHTATTAVAVCIATAMIPTMEGAPETSVGLDPGDADRVPPAVRSPRRGLTHAAMLAGVAVVALGSVVSLAAHYLL